MTFLGSIVGTVAAIVAVIAVVIIVGSRRPTVVTSDGSASGRPVPATAKKPAAPKTPATTPDAGGLIWGDLAGHPAQAEINKARAVDDLDVLTIFYGLKGKGFDPAEFSHFFPQYRKADDFEKRRLASEVVVQLEERWKTLKTSSLRAQIDEAVVGDYDFKRKGFPLFKGAGFGGDGDGRGPGLKSWANFSDYSASGQTALSQVNAMARVQGDGQYSRLYAQVDFGNDSRRFPHFVHVDEASAERLSKEFGYIEDPQTKAIAQATGVSYTGNKTIVAYAIFVPRAAKTSGRYMAGVYVDLKEVEGRAQTVILATPKGTVFGVLPIESAPQVRGAERSQMRTPRTKTTLGGLPGMASGSKPQKPPSDSATDLARRQREECPKLNRVMQAMGSGSVSVDVVSAVGMDNMQKILEEAPARWDELGCAEWLTKQRKNGVR